jgi:hypothetical protein
MTTRKSLTKVSFPINVSSEAPDFKVLSIRGKSRYSSPFEKLDGFVKLHLNRGAAQGYITDWSISSTLDNAGSSIYKITYQIGGNRYCSRIERQHKSNHVMMEVNCARRCMYQRCWDIDCRGYTSNEIIVPIEIVPTLEELNALHLE